MRERPRTTREWLALITQCRSSGLTDKEWCEQYGVNMSTFYNAINRLRKKACEILDMETLQPVIDFTTKQDVVAINVVPDSQAIGQMVAPPNIMQTPTEIIPKSRKHLCNGTDQRQSYT